MSESLGAQINQFGPANTASAFHDNYGKFQREGSTYVWKITRPGKTTLPGYSKPKNPMQEKANKQDLIMDIVRRMHRAAGGAYLQHGGSITFYRCFSNYDSDNVKIFTLFENRYEIEVVAIGEAFLVKFLADFYRSSATVYGTALFPTGDDIAAAPPIGKQVIPDRPAWNAKPDPYDETRRFKTSDSLVDYVQALIERGEPKGRVEDYYRKMSIKLRL